MHKIQQRQSPAIRWHLDEVFVKIKGETHYLWRAVDEQGEVIESFVTKKSDKKAALKFLKKCMKHNALPDEIVTDRLPTYAALSDLNARKKHVMGKGLNNRAENSYLTFRQRERAIIRFRTMQCLQKFVSIHSSFYISSLFGLRYASSVRAFLQSNQPFKPQSFSSSQRPDQPTME